ncbi:MAG: bifunctional 4-hydroxy-2-oxoglutarate aldolase/2-dehydro-3-deoxy-phosphogluconate aldolase [Polyangiaceae bacterium]|nr:bifunctional 4-hydroxy-2-oxoglutarate aldolase/2-dehydro-3-deoxy-phosphogluconate aldolase [Polyangiaceae bacterium]
MMPAMAGVAAEILEHGLIAVIDTPMLDHIFDWSLAVAEGGIRIVAVPVTAENVTELVSDLSDQADLMVGINGVVAPEHVSLAIAAGADFVLSPIASPEIISACKGRGILIVAGGATPTELASARAAGADLVSLHPAGVLGGPAYFEAVARSLGLPHLLASGMVDVENAPSFLERGAAATIIDRGLFPDSQDPAALDVIRARASALSEICADVLGVPSRISLSDVLETGAQ